MPKKEIGLAPSRANKATSIEHRVTLLLTLRRRAEACKISSNAKVVNSCALICIFYALFLFAIVSFPGAFDYHGDGGRERRENCVCCMLKILAARIVGTPRTESCFLMKRFRRIGKTIKETFCKKVRFCVYHYLPCLLATLTHTHIHFITKVVKLRRLRHAG